MKRKTEILHFTHRYTSADRPICNESNQVKSLSDGMSVYEVYLPVYKTKMAFGSTWLLIEPNGNSVFGLLQVVKRDQASSLDHDNRDVILVLVHFKYLLVHYYF